MPYGETTTTDLDRLIAEARPRLHRYCARMLGSAIDGEDVVQEALIKASLAWPEGGGVDHPEGWLFRIAHNAALDAIRKRRRHAARQAGGPFADMADPAATADVRVAATASLAAFLALSVSERSSVILVDVLGHDLAETAQTLGLTVPALKAALHRGRGRLQQRAADPAGDTARLDPDERERLRAYADRFNARDFDALRALLADDVRLDLVNRTRLYGRKDVSVYFSRYDATSDWRFTVGLAEGRPALLVTAPADPDGPVIYVVLLDWAAGAVSGIRDFRFAPYVAESLAVTRL